MPHPQTTLSARDLWAGESSDVVRGVSLDLTPGQSPVGLIGPMGSGKSSLLFAMLGLTKPRGGTVTWGGSTVHRLRGSRKKQFGAAVRRVSQNGIPVADRRSTASRELTRALATARRTGRSSSATVEDLMDLVLLGPQHDSRPIATLSGGEQQRLALALALATRPEILVLDEPLSAVDPAMRGEIARLLSSVVEDDGIAVLLATHDLELVERLCPTVHVLADGTFVASGSMRDILAAPEHPAVRDLAEAAPRAVQRFR
ncbi:ABC transporter ATP-binding protein [Paraoerskovia marina]|uniref:ABC transporter ATP-binding protein n=1 Tax=Paraoerskovia marina TaxID=545619 RepID=UPI000492E482|nr:ATP-binding cassette domain-containing protein [Paraoerskovia marina]